MKQKNQARSELEAPSLQVNFQSPRRHYACYCRGVGWKSHQQSLLSVKLIKYKTNLPCYMCPFMDQWHYCCDGNHFLIRFEVYSAEMNSLLLLL